MQLTTIYKKLNDMVSKYGAILSGIVIIYFFSRGMNEFYLGSLLKLLAYGIIFLFSFLEMIPLLSYMKDNFHKNKFLYTLIIIYFVYIAINGLLFLNFKRFAYGVKFYIVYPLFFFLFWLKSFKVTDKKILSKIFYVVSLITFVIAIYENASGNFIVPIEIDPSNMSAVGTMVGDKFVYRSLGLVNSFLTNGMICSVFTFIYFWLSIYKNKIYFFPCFIGLIALFATGSRGPMVALFVSVLVLIYIYIRQNKLIERLESKYKIICLISFILLVLLALYVVFSNVSFGIDFIDIKIERIRQIFDWKNNAANSTRIKIWLESLAVFAKSPLFGIGIGSTGATGLGTVTSMVTESGVLKVLVETGIVGFVSYFLIIFYSIYILSKRVNDYVEQKYLSFLVILIVLIENSIMQILSDPVVFLMFTCFFALQVNKKTTI